ncbi:MAG: DUF4390 domain-containing protein [Acidobacteria bacterium]|nr:MAG: DUF4390 domain-containing protein [Acidobacteriota bacterium]
MKANTRWRGRLVALLLCIVAATGALAVAEKAQIAGLRIESAGDQFLLSFRLIGAFDDELRRRLESGLPTNLNYRFRLQRERRRWFDKDLASGTLEVVAMYNAVQRQYLVNYKRDGDLVESRVVRQEDELRRAMTEIERLPAFTLADVPPAARSRRLEVKVRAELGTKMFLWLIPMSIATDWARSDLRIETSPGV